MSADSSSTAAAASVLSINGLRKRFGEAEVLKGIDLEVKRGETTVILGASGSGKSTLLRCVNFLEMPSAGDIFLEGKRVGDKSASGETTYRESELKKLRAHVGMVFQQFNLFPHMTVLQNVMLAPMKVQGIDHDAARKRALANLDRMGIVEKASSYPSSLSGGQQQRVAIARALAMEPALMLFDEATSALDPELVGEVLQAMKQLSQDGMTMLVVTHELGFAYHVAHRVLFLHQGQIHEQGTPDEVLVSPKQARTQEFMRSHTAFSLPDVAAA
ncbi:amino acid ABC transporter ATP-binding protein [soil metagenome]